MGKRTPGLSIDDLRLLAAIFPETANMACRNDDVVKADRYDWKAMDYDRKAMDHEERAQIAAGEQQAKHR